MTRRNMRLPALQPLLPCDPLQPILMAALVLGLCLIPAGCRGSGNKDRLPPDVTAGSPRAARLAGPWIGFNESPNATYQFISADFAKNGDYTAVIYTQGGQQAEQKGRWQVEGNELVLDGQQRWELEFRRESMVVLRDPDARIFHQLARRR